MRYLWVVLLLAGCSHVSIDTNTNAPHAHAGVHVESRSFAAVVIAGMFLAAALEDAREPRPMPSFASFADWFRAPPKAELHPDRPVQEQDCTRPVELGGNLKCR